MFIQDMITLFLNVHPTSVLLTIAAGIIWSVVFNDWYIDRKTVIAVIAFLVPFVAARFVYIVTTGDVFGTGLLGYFFIVVYAASAFITRKILRHYNVNVPVPWERRKVNMPVMGGRRYDD